MTRSYWTAAKREAYLAKTARTAEERRRLADGEDVAAQLLEIWQGLSAAERAFLLQCLDSGRSSVVAQHDAPVLRDLVAKRLLQYPRGVGGSWMRNMRTTYKVAPAVWRELRCNQDVFGASQDFLIDPGE